MLILSGHRRGRCPHRPVKDVVELRGDVGIAPYILFQAHQRVQELLQVFLAVEFQFEAAFFLA